MTIQEKRNQIAARTDETIREETAREIAPCASRFSTSSTALLIKANLENSSVLCKWKKRKTGK